MGVCRVKRTIAVAIIFALVLSLALPAAAFAKRGGVPASGNGRGHTQASPGADEEGAESGATEPAPGPVPEEGKGKSKADKATSRQEGIAEDLEDDEGGEEPLRSRETTPPGWAIALSHLEANRARMQAQIDAGVRKSLPPGLVSVIAKFMERLGIVEVPAEDDAAGDDATDADGTEDDEATEDGGTVEDPVQEGQTEPDCDSEPVIVPEMATLWLLMR